MFRLWGKIWKDNHMIKDTVICNDEQDTRTHKVFKALEEICYQFDLGKPIWLDSTITEFKRHDKARFTQDNFVEAIDEAGVKTIVYAPYRKHIDNIVQRLEADGKDGIAVAYHSGLTADSKNLAYNSFKDNETKVMISTKAFGMGVDIPDIQLVYHHAPSGLLPDYVQEVGRAARKPEIQG